MEHNFLELTIAYPRDLDEEVNTLLAKSEILGTEVVDSHTIKDYEERQPEWELADEGELLDGQKALLSEDLDENSLAQKVYFEDSSRGGLAMEKLERTFYERYGGEIQIMGEDRVVNDHWDREWKKFYHPINVGEGIQILPAWEQADSGDREVIRINPGMAFGTGSHETTTLCLRILEKETLQDKECLDLGCGSGILGVYMKKRGAQSVLGADLDEDALQSARENAKGNGVEISFQSSDLFSTISGSYDLICANLLAVLLLRMLPETGNHLKTGGRLILSGILAEKKEEVLEALEENGFATLQILQDGEWVAMEAKRKDDQ